MTKSINPKIKHAVPPFDTKPQDEFPGIESKMNPQPDYGKNSYKGNQKLKNKVALITGGDSGIGRAVAYTFAAEGADIAISYLSENSDAKQIEKDIKDLGKKVLLLPGDIGEEKHCIDIVEKTVDQFGKLDVLVNNAAFQKPRPSIVDVTAEELERMYKTNIFAIFYLCKAAYPKMKPGSSIINTTSVQAYNPSQGLLTYASTKGAVSNFTKCFAQEAIASGIRVNAVAPGPVWTPFIPASTSKNDLQNFGESSLLGRPAQPIEQATVFVFLASDDASYVVGEVYGATGSIRKP